MNTLILKDKTKVSSSQTTARTFSINSVKDGTQIPAVSVGIHGVLMETGSIGLFATGDVVLKPIQSSLGLVHIPEVQYVSVGSGNGSLNFTSSSSKVMNNINKVIAYYHLQQGWNGYDAMPIPPIVINNALTSLPSFSKQPHVSPTARGTIQFDFENGDDFLEAEIYTDRVSVYQSKNDEEEEYNTDIFQLAIHINNFYAP